MPKLPTQSLRWDTRAEFEAMQPDSNRGQPNMSYTYFIRSKEGNFSVHVTFVRNGTPDTGYPFEVWIGGEFPRGLSALSKSLSMDLRSNDRGWLRKKLESLKDSDGVPFDFVRPDGALALVPGAVAAFAIVVEDACKRLGAFEQGGDTPVLNALLSAKEPKTSSEGAPYHGWDIFNPMTEDEGAVVIKDARGDDGKRYPQSVWLSGSFPKALDGWCKSISLDMQVAEIGWIARKLKQLDDVHEPRGEFRAQVPGTEKTAEYPSTVAYIAALIRHRYVQLGHMTPAGDPVEQTGVIQLALVREQREPAVATNGSHCSDCGAYAVRKIDGCMTCGACGSSSCS
jgi:ribonucleoside-diphosphate reductase alpha chain